MTQQYKDVKNSEADDYVVKAGYRRPKGAFAEGEAARTKSASAESPNQSVGHLFHQLKDEVEQLESRAAHWLLKAADPTNVELRRLDQCIATGEHVLLAGEVASDQVLTCLGCERNFTVRGTVMLSACSCCGSEYFEAESTKH